MIISFLEFIFTTQYGVVISCVPIALGSGEVSFMVTIIFFSVSTALSTPILYPPAVFYPILKMIKFEV
jgi:hypothetical protein